MQNIEQQAQEIYSKNIEYFKKYHQNIYNKLLTLNSSNYDLEYLDGYFDVKELKSGNYLYASNSNSISNDLASLVDFSKNRYIFEGFPLYYNVEKQKNLDDKSIGLEGIYPLMSYYIDTVKENSEFKQIEKFIFIGVGLGIHIPLIHNKIKAQEYLIIEDDLELFHLCLFVTPFYEFKDSAKLLFLISEDDHSFVEKMESFLEDSFYLNRYLKYSYFPAHFDKKIKLIQNVLSAQEFISFPYKTRLMKFLKPLEYLNRDFKIINLSNKLEKSVFQDYPVLVLGAGPSLHKNIEWLKQNHQKFILISVSSLSKTLYQNNIKPDIVVHLDGFEAVLKVFEGFDAKEFLKDSIMLFGPFTPTIIRESFNKENIFLTEESTQYNKGFNSINGPCVGSTAILNAIMFNSKNIYLLGTDFSIAKTGHTHSPTHVTKTVLDMKQKDSLKDTISFRQNLFPIRGNFEPIVYTNSLFHVSLQALYNRIPLLKDATQNIFNLNDGANIHLAKPLHIEQLDILNFKNIDKNKLHSSIKNSFT